FFLLLVQHTRAGTKTLQAYFLRQIEKIRRDRLVLKNRLDVEEHLSERNQTIYYSAWYYSAIHVMLSVPQFQTKEAISDYIGMPLGLVSSVLDFLVSGGLAKYDGNKFQIRTKRIHLGSDSSLISKHHMNWRLRAMHALDQQINEDLHYSFVVSLSRKDVEKMKALLIEQIQTVKEQIRISPEEEIYSFCLDFFRV
ncbi:MAG: DUF4423 domain-containing protein, partial [Deltaproteobacteria bacterium]|nr:DUF4423 domain-containing protein [Deltaproteobacteria bacterium]